MFILEQEEYRREGIDWEFIDFGLDLKPTIELIDKSQPVGVFSCLDEECVLPKATDRSFTEKLHSLWSGKSSKYGQPRFNMGFSIQHYASQVEYDTSGWLEKNKDALNESVCRLLAKSNEPFVAQLFSDYEQEPTSSSTLTKSTGGLSRTFGRAGFRTVAMRHKEQLNLLMTQLNSTEPHFVRCIVPNTEKRAGKIDTRLVLEQLRCNGVLEGIRITRQGFPNREAFTEFRQRYEILAPHVVPRERFVDSKQAVQLILESLNLDSSMYRLGNTKVFFRAGELAALEEIRDLKLSAIITQFQAMARGKIARTMYNRRIEQAKAIRVIQKNALLYNQLIEWPWWNIYKKVKPLLQVTRVEEELKKKEDQIAEWKKKADAEKVERESAEKQLHEWNSKKEELERMLMSERSAFLDQEEVLKRTRERESKLEEDLKEHTDAIASIETQYEELAKENEELKKSIEELKEKMEEESQASRELLNTREVEKTQVDELERTVKEYKERAERATLDYEQKSALVEELEKRITILGQEKENVSSQHEIVNSRIKELEEEVDIAIKEQNDAVEAAEHYKKALELVHEQLTETKKAMKSEIESRDREAAVQLELKANAASQIGSLTSQLESVMGEKERLRDSLQRTENELNTMRELVEQHAGSSTSEAELRNMLERETEHLKSSLAQIQGEFDETRKNDSAKISELKMMVDQKTQELETLKQTNSALSKSVEEMCNNADESAQREYEIQSDIGKVKKQLSDALELVEQSQFDYEQAKAEAEDLKSQNEIIEKELQAANASVKDLESKLESVKMSSTDHENVRNTLTREVVDFKTIVEDMKKMVNERETENEQLKKTIESQNNELNELIETINEMSSTHQTHIEETRSAVHSELEDLRKAYEELESRTHMAEKSKSKFTEEISDLSLLLEKEQKLSSELMKQNELLSEEIEKYKEQVRDVESKLEQTAGAVESLENKSRELQGEINVRDSKLSMLNDSKQKLDKELRNLISEIGDGTRSVHELEKKRTSLESEVADLKRQLELEKNSRVAAEEIKRRWEEQQDEFRRRIEAEVDAKAVVIEESRKLLMEEINEMGEKLDEENALRVEAQLEVAKLTQELKTLQESIDNRSVFDHDEENKLRQQIHSLNNSLTESKMQLEIQKKSLSDYEALASRHEHKSNILQTSLEKLQTESELNSRKIRQAERRIEEITAEAAFHLDSRNKMETKVIGLQKENKDLRSAITSYEHELENLKIGLSQSTRMVENMKELELKNEGTRSLIDRDITKLEESCLELKAALRVAQQDAEDKQTYLTELDLAYNDLQVLNNQLKAEVERKSRDCDVLTSDMNQLSRQLKDEKRASETSGVHIQTLEQTIDALNKKLEDARLFSDDSESKLHRLEKSNMDMENQLQEALANVQEVTAARDMAESELLELKNRYNELVNIVDELKDQGKETEAVREHLLREVEAVSERHRLDIEDHDTALDSLRAKYQVEMEMLANELDSLNKEHLALRESYIQLDNKLVAANIDSDRLVAENSALKKELSHAVDKLEELAPAYESARDAAKANESQASGMRLELESTTLRVQALESALAEAHASKVRLEERIGVIQDKYVQVSNARHKAEQAALQLEDELKRLRLQVSESDERSAVLSTRQDKYSAQVEELQAALKRERSASTEMARQNHALESSNKQLKRQVMDLEAKLVHSSSMSAKRYHKLDVSAMGIPKPPTPSILVGGGGGGGGGSSGLNNPDYDANNSNSNSNNNHRHSNDSSSSLARSIISNSNSNTNTNISINDIEISRTSRQLRELQTQVAEYEKNKARMISEYMKLGNKLKRMETNLSELENNNDILVVEKKRKDRMIVDLNDQIAMLQKELVALRK